VRPGLAGRVAARARTGAIGTGAIGTGARFSRYPLCRKL